MKVMLIQIQKSLSTIGFFFSVDKQSTVPKASDSSDLALPSLTIECLKYYIDDLQVADEIISELPGIYGETEALSEVQLINITICFI